MSLDDSIRTSIESENIPLELGNLVWPEINLQQVDDILLAELLKLDDYDSDASGSVMNKLLSEVKLMDTLNRSPCTKKSMKTCIRTKEMVCFC